MISNWMKLVFIVEKIKCSSLVIWLFPSAINSQGKKRSTQQTPERMNTSLVYFSHIVFLVQHMETHQEGRRHGAFRKKKKFLGFLKEKLNVGL